MNNHRGSATEPNNGVAQTRQHLQIMVGEQVQKDGTVYRISQVLDFETVIVIAVESGRSCPLRIKELAPLNSGSVSPEQDMSERGLLMMGRMKLLVQQFGCHHRLLLAVKHCQIVPH